MGRQKSVINGVPAGCCHPDCFNCPMTDCRRDNLNAESYEINLIIKRQLKAEEEQKKQAEADYLMSLYWQQTKQQRGKGRPRKYFVN